MTMARGKGRGRGKTPAAEIGLRLEQIAERLAAGCTDKDVIKDLNLKERTFYYYKAEISRIYGDITAKKTEQALDFEAEVLKDRYLRLYRSLEQRIIGGGDSNNNFGSSSSSDTTTPTTASGASLSASSSSSAKPSRLHDIAIASEVAANLATQIFRLEFEGFMRRKTIKQLGQSEEDAAKYV
ncbi:MAG: hypothetical protein ACJ71G_03765 [Nitrososphaeraceae archaeon]